MTFAPKNKIKFMKTEEPREIIKEFFNYIGVGFNEFKGHKLKIEESLIYVTQTVPHMERIKESFAQLKEQIEAFGLLFVQSIIQWKSSLMGGGLANK